jgi:hypothetical protein
LSFDAALLDVDRSPVLHLMFMVIRGGTADGIKAVGGTNRSISR